MVSALNGFAAIILGFGAGTLTAGAVFAFIAITGIVPRVSQKTKTAEYIKLYETSIAVGGILGASTLIFNYYIPAGKFIVIIFSLCIGIFIGSLAVSIAEVLNIIPILTRRINIKKGLSWLIIAIAAGKTIGALLYFIIPGFYEKT